MNASFHVYKYQALGNDMLVVDPLRFSPPLTAEVARLLCDRHFGLGADGICYGPLSTTGVPHTMRFFNPDGSQAEKSGNGLRIFARYLVDAGYVTSRQFGISLGGADAWVQQLDDAAQRFAISMGKVSFLSDDIPMSGPPREVVAEPLALGQGGIKITAVNVGNPHCVIFSDDLAAITELGPLLEIHPAFPNRTNVQLVQVVDRSTIRIAIWERGAGYTLASGTSACATAAAAVRNGFCQSPVTVQMDGGTAIVTLDQGWQASLAGSVAAVFQGQLADDLVQQLSELAAPDH